MKAFLKNKRIQIFIAISGGVGGFLYWKFIGCVSGTCPIKSVWYWSTLWGLLMGYLVGDIIYDFLKKRGKKERKEDERKISEHN